MAAEASAVTNVHPDPPGGLTRGGVLAQSLEQNGKFNPIEDTRTRLGIQRRNLLLPFLSQRARAPDTTITRDAPRPRVSGFPRNTQIGLSKRPKNSNT